MKNITLFFIIFLSSFGFSQSPFQVIGSEEFGRIFDLTYDKSIENKVYALTLGNHIISSDDNGQTWEIFYSHPQGDLDGLKFIESENALSFYSKNTSNYSLMIYDLTSQTITKEFQLPFQSADGEWINSYSIWENDTDVALVGQGFKIGIANYEKAQYTTDGGETWTEVYYTVDNFNIFLNNVAIDPDDSSKLFLMRGNGNTDIDGGLLISEDGGQTWTEKLAGIGFKPIAFHPENSGEIWVGSSLFAGTNHSQGLYKSTDGGETWDLIPIAWTDYILDCINIIEFNPSNPDNIIVLEENEVAISNDGGATWDVNVYPNAYDNIEDYCYGLKASFNPFNEDELLISSNYYPFFSTDKGETMERVKTPYFVSDGNIKFFSNGEEAHLYYGAQFGFVHRNLQTMEDNAYNIMALNMVSNSPGTTLHIDPKMAGRTFSFSGGFMGSSLKVSDDHGATQNQIFMIFSNESNVVASLPNETNIVWAAFSSFGENVEIQRIDFTDMDNVQTEMINTPQAEGRVMNILFDETNPDNVTISQGGRIYKSTNGGTSWSDSSAGLESLHNVNDLIMKMVKNPLNPNQLTISSSGGIFTSLDNGANWEAINSSFAHNIAHSPYTDGYIVAMIHNSNASGFGLRFTKDGGETWETVDPADLYFLNSTQVFTSTAINFGEESADIYIATSDLGLVKFELNLETLSVSDPEFISADLTTIYPNPAKDFLNIACKKEVKSVEIFNMAGQKILVDNHTEINISHLNKGIYLVRISLESGKTETKKLIKN